MRSTAVRARPLRKAGAPGGSAGTTACGRLRSRYGWVFPQTRGMVIPASVTLISEMTAAMRQLWISVLSVLIVFGMGLQALPVPCQSSLCGSSCAVSCTHCPSSCTCHLSPTAAPGGSTSAALCHDNAADAPIAESLHCLGGIDASAGLPDFALPHPPLPAALSLVTALSLAIVPDLPLAHLTSYRPVDVDPPLRPPAA